MTKRILVLFFILVFFTGCRFTGSVDITYDPFNRGLIDRPNPAPKKEELKKVTLKKRDLDITITSLGQKIEKTRPKASNNAELQWKVHVESTSKTEVTNLGTCRTISSSVGTKTTEEVVNQALPLSTAASTSSSTEKMITTVASNNEEDYILFICLALCIIGVISALFLIFTKLIMVMWRRKKNDDNAPPPTEETKDADEGTVNTVNVVEEDSPLEESKIDLEISPLEELAQRQFQLLSKAESDNHTRHNEIMSRVGELREVHNDLRKMMTSLDDDHFEGHTDVIERVTTMQMNQKKLCIWANRIYVALENLTKVVTYLIPRSERRKVHQKSRRRRDRRRQKQSFDA